MPWTVTLASCDHPYDVEYSETHIATGEVTALKHELGDHTMELGASVTKAFLASTESTEVLASLGDDIVIEDEIDAAGLVCENVSEQFLKQETINPKAMGGDELFAKVGQGMSPLMSLVARPLWSKRGPCHATSK